MARRTASSAWSTRLELPRLGAAAMWTVDRMRWPIEALGVEFPKFRATLEMRLWLESIAAADSKAHGLRTAISLGVVALYASIGGVAGGVVALMSHDLRLWLLVGLGAWMFSLLLLALAQLANLVTDASDIEVLSPLPISDGSVLAARLAHVLVYSFLFTVFSAIAPTILGCLVFDPWRVCIVYPIAAFATAALVIGAVGCGFALVLRLFGPGRFQRLTFWVQVLGGAILMLAVQVLPRLDGARAAMGRALEDPYWRWLVPPLHFEGLYAVLGGAATTNDWMLAATGIFAPVIVGATALALARRRFVAALKDPSSSSRALSTGFRSGIFERLGARFCSSPTALAAHGWALAMSRRERAFLRAAVPQVVMFFTLAVLMFARPAARGGGFDASAAPMAIYMLLLGATTALLAAEYAEKPDVKAVFEPLPVESAKALLEGAAKALLLGTIFPTICIGALLISALTGPAGWLEIALATIATSCAATVLAARCVRDLPFARQPSAMPAAHRFGWTLAVLSVAIGLILLHLILRTHVAATLAGVTFFAWRLRVAWQALETIRPRSRSIVARLGSSA